MDIDTGCYRIYILLEGYRYRVFQNIWHWKDIDTGCYGVHTTGSVKIQGGTEYMTLEV